MDSTRNPRPRSAIELNAATAVPLVHGPESLGVLAGGIAHDFNNLLQGIFGYISVAKIAKSLEQKGKWWPEPEPIGENAGMATGAVAPRPGHADLAGAIKYRQEDARNILERSSARETAVRVAAGAIAKKYLRERLGVGIRACVEQIGPVEIERKDWDAVNANPFFCPDPARVPELDALIDRLRSEGDSVGARLYVEARNVPPGLGEPVYDRLDAEIAYALMSINAVKGVEIGDGMRVAAMRGTEHRDEMTPEGFLGNHSGGIAGGISTGQPVYARLAIKPTSSITTPGKSIDESGAAVEMRTTGRHDPCVGLRAAPIAEAMLALVLMDHYLRHRAQNADVVPATPKLPAGDE